MDDVRLRPAVLEKLMIENHALHDDEIKAVYKRLEDTFASTELKL